MKGRNEQHIRNTRYMDEYNSLGGIDLEIGILILRRSWHSRSERTNVSGVGNICLFFMFLFYLRISFNSIFFLTLMDVFNFFPNAISLTRAFW